jgi:single-stranded-DNA-specific exonuclease
MGHPEPVFLTRGLLLAAPPRIVKDKHICLQLCASTDGPALSAMGWTRAGQTPWPERIAADNLDVGSVIDVVYRFRENQHPIYGGVELEMIDCQAGCVPSAEPAATYPA